MALLPNAAPQLNAPYPGWGDTSPGGVGNPLIVFFHFSFCNVFFQHLSVFLCCALILLLVKQGIEHSIDTLKQNKAHHRKTKQTNMKS